MQKKEIKLPITAFVASCNEADLLDSCLKGLWFCEEIYVIDLKSNDNTIEVATQNNAKVLNFPRYPIVEIAHHRAIKFAKNDWILLTDPDEVVDYQLATALIDLFKKKIPSNIAAIKVPVQFYFNRTPLKGTNWGGDRIFRLLYNKNLIKTSEIVHHGVSYDVTKTIYIKKRNQQTVLHHYWMTSYKNLFEKHNRYIKLEGKKLYKEGRRYSMVSQITNALRSFKSSFIGANGYKDGTVGLFLSLFWAYYNFKCYSSLASYQKENKLN